MKQLQYGIVSTATIVPRFVGALKQSKHSSAYALYSRSLEKGKQWAEQLDIKHVFDDYDTMLDDPNIDVIYIASPNEHHVHHIRKALLKGKHVLCEKPFVLQGSEVKEMFDLAKEKKLFLMEAQKSVFLPVYAKLKEVMANESLGKLRHIDMTQSYIATQYPKDHWMYDKHQGGILFGSGAYPIEIMMHVLDLPKVEFQITGTKSHRGATDTITMSFVCNDDILVNSRLTMNFMTNNMAYFYFDEGYVAIHEFWKARKATVHDITGKLIDTWEFPCPFEMVYEVNEAHNCITSGRLTSDVMTEAMTFACVDIVEKMAKMME